MLLIRNFDFLVKSSYYYIKQKLQKQKKGSLKIYDVFKTSLKEVFVLFSHFAIFYHNISLSFVAIRILKCQKIFKEVIYDNQIIRKLCYVSNIITLRKISQLPFPTLIGYFGIKREKCTS